MVPRNIEDFSEVRTTARAYFCYLFSKNLPNHLPEIDLDSVTGRLRKIMGDLSGCEGVYVLDNKGIQVTPTFLPNGEKKVEDINLICSSRAYYYRAMKERRCTITDPYPSLITMDLTVTASKPIFNEKGDVVYVACLDMPMPDVIKLARPTATDSLFGKISKFTYTMFSLALAMVSLLLFIKGIEQFTAHGLDFQHVLVKEIFEATILLTLSLAIFDLVKTIFEEEVMGRHERKHSSINKTMVKFLGSIIIALSIEALMLVFKFALTDPAMIINAIYIIGGVSMLLIGQAVYTHFSKSEE